MTDLIRIFTERGDLAHLALLFWAMSASALAWFALRELTAASRRSDDFVRELARPARNSDSNSRPRATFGMRRPRAMSPR